MSSSAPFPSRSSSHEQLSQCSRLLLHPSLLLSQKGVGSSIGRTEMVGVVLQLVTAMAIATCMGEDRAGEHGYLAKMTTRSQERTSMSKMTCCDLTREKLHLRGGGLADFMFTALPEATESRKSKGGKKIHYVENSEVILAEKNVRRFRRELRKHVELMQREMDDEPFPTEAQDECEHLNVSDYPVSSLECPSTLGYYKHNALVREEFEESKRLFEENQIEDNELYGVDRLKHGLRGFMPGPPAGSIFAAKRIGSIHEAVCWDVDLIEDLKKRGVDGPWNNPSDTSAWKPLRYALARQPSPGLDRHFLVTVNCGFRAMIPSSTTRMEGKSCCRSCYVTG
eukprot:747574-Hanusia_phi.AAC.4